MKHLLAGFLSAVSLAAVAAAQGPPQGRSAQAPPGPPSPAAQKHIDAARAAAGAEHAVMVDKLCGRAAPTQSTERAQPRAAGSVHPYVVGIKSVQNYLTVASECAQAAIASLPAQ